jgi:DNA-binding NtrC family response regulator
MTSSMRGFRVLIIDSDTSFRRNAARYLCGRGYEVIEVSTSAEGLGALDEHLPEFVLVNLNQKDAAGLDLVQACVAHRSRTKVICTAKAVRIATAVQAVKAGAIDVLERPVDAERLYRLLEEHKPPCDVAETPKSDSRPVELTEPLVVDLLVAEDERMQRALDRVDEAAKSERPITLVCERPMSEQLARRYLAASPRAGGPFVVVPEAPADVAAEDMLFGTASQPSAFSLAKGGVVYIESLESLGAAGRDRLSKLLKGLAESRASGVEVRWPPMIIATEEEPAIDGRLERDVADQLAPTAVVVPRLHARGADAQRLLANITAAIAKAVHATGTAINPDVAHAIIERSLTGGVKELVRLASESARLDPEGRLVLELGHRRERRDVKSLGLSRSPGNGWAPTPDQTGRVQRFDVYEAEIFRFALRNAGGCVSRAAELLGVGRATMYRKMRAYQIDVPPVSERSIARGRRRAAPSEEAIVQ